MSVKLTLIASWSSKFKTSVMYLSINCGTLTSVAEGVPSVLGKIISTKLTTISFSSFVK